MSAGVRTSCPHRPPCPGCPRFGEPGPSPAARTALEALARQHGLPGVAVVSGAARGFRLRARLAIRGRPGAPKLGMFQLGTHRVVPIPDCSVQHPLVNRVANDVRRALVDTGVAPYAEPAHVGLARYLQVVVERDSQRAQVTLVANSPAVDPLARCLDLVRERLGNELHSLWFNAHCERSNAILGPGFQNWCGPESVVERFGGPAVHYPPGARVAEFYAGVGAIGLSLLPRLGEIRMNEVSPHSLHGLALGIAALSPEERAKVEVVPGPAGEACHAAAGADVVIADPPRKGLDRELASYLGEKPPALFVYVSCGLESFLADVARLTSGGQLRLRELRAFNLMPYTGHVETVACFERS